MTISRFLKYWLPALLWMGLIFFMSTDTGSATHTSRILEPLLRWLNPQISGAAIEQAHFIIRKCGHLSEYAMLSLLIWRALMHYRAGISGDQALKCAALALVISVAYAVTDEFHQSFNPSRTASPRDVLIDSCGALIGLSLALMMHGRRIRLARQA